MSEQNRTRITVALAGQPNVGKSTVFNMLTGLSQHVGNWPGKTIEQKTGEFSRNGLNIRLIDLPGTYSLTANSEEECVARDYILRQRPDAIIAIVNTAALERNLYLVAELLVLPIPVVIGLNMVDVAEQHGIHVEAHVLEAALGIPVVPLVASRNQGVGDLLDAVERLLDEPEAFTPNRPVIGEEHLPILEEIRSHLDGYLPSHYPDDWAALKLLEGDTEVTARVREALPEDEWTSTHDLLKQHEDAYLDIAGTRYEWIGRMVRAAVVRPKLGAVTLTERIDRVATHPVWGLALLLCIFAFVFWVTYTVATPIVEWLDVAVMQVVAEQVRLLLASAPVWLSGLVVDGLFAGAGTVLTFLPILVIFFAMLGMLEDVGYFARAAYVMDRFMHWMGLHGKSFMPLFLGFGCNVPAVMGARIMEDRRSQLSTILLTPLVPCTARMAVIIFLAPAFFGQAATFVSWGLIAFNLILLAILGILINRLVFRGEHTAFIMEIPLYHLPNARTIGLFVWQNTWAFIKKAGTLILIFSAVIWVLSALPGGDIEHSLLAGLGRRLEPVGRWMGLGDWRLMVSLLTSFVAKENTIATLGILFGVAEGSGSLAERVAAGLTPAGALAFLVVQMLFIPCVATVAAIRQETASWRWTAFSVSLSLVLSLLGGIGAFQIMRLIGY
ncbi:MAG: ferrous iron transport protein B [Anaerolineae bacterium]|nr:ferrous iron transport protein B [Anaerolineae bacterium]